MSSEKPDGLTKALWAPYSYIKDGEFAATAAEVLLDIAIEERAKRLLLADRTDTRDFERQWVAVPTAVKDSYREIARTAIEGDDDLIAAREYDHEQE